MNATLPIRLGFWNVPLWAEIGVYVVGIIAVILCVAGVFRAIRIRKQGAAPLTVTATAAERTRRVLSEGLGQSRILRRPSGKAHFAIFWGFIALFWGTATATLDWDVGHYIFNQQFLTGRFYLIYKLILDAAGFFALLGLGWAAWRRFIRQDPNVAGDYRFACILGSLAAIIVSGFVLEALRLAVLTPAWSAFSPVGHVIALTLTGFSADTLKAAHTLLWVVHGLASLIFIAVIPLTYYGHIFKTPTSIFWQKLEPRGALPKIDSIEEQESFGVSRFEQLTWLDRVRLDGCTECGRCRSVCPAVRAGTPLDPKELVLTLQHRMKGLNTNRELIGGLIDKQALWSCTTCNACAEACPAQIPIPEMIVAMRRHLALEQGEFPDGLAGALENTASVGNPWGMDPGSRLDWAAEMDVPVARPDQPVDVLYWVGCSASYDRRAQKIARAMVRIFQAAHVNFAVMQEERCHADFARRAGEEYLFQTAAAENIENLGKYRFKCIVAACPHCFNTLKNEYPQFENGRFEVISHTQYIEQLIETGRLALETPETLPTVLHDACYLARYNDDTRSPRRILKAAAVPLREAAHCGCDALCCGAGGAQIFMDRPARVNVIRLKELQQTQADSITVTCPHCLTMLNSAQAQAADDSTALRIDDIAEIVASRLANSSSSSSSRSTS